jgi:hypothetical protein
MPSEDGKTSKGVGGRILIAVVVVVAGLWVFNPDFKPDFQQRVKNAYNAATNASQTQLADGESGITTTPATTPATTTPAAAPAVTTPQPPAPATTTPPATATPVVPEKAKIVFAKWIEAYALRKYLQKAQAKKLGRSLKYLPARKALRARYRGRAPRLLFCTPRSTCNRKSASKPGNCEYGYWVKKIKKQKGEPYDTLYARQVHLYPAYCPSGLTVFKATFE